jgi:hypothetical protein
MDGWMDGWMGGVPGKLMGSRQTNRMHSTAPVQRSWLSGLCMQRTRSCTVHCMLCSQQFCAVLSIGIPIPISSFFIAQISNVQRIKLL